MTAAGQHLIILVKDVILRQRFQQIQCRGADRAVILQPDAPNLGDHMPVQAQILRVICISVDPVKAGCADFELIHFQFLPILCIYPHFTKQGR